MGLEQLDIALRGAGTGMAMLAVALLWTSRVDRAARLSFMALVFCTACRVWTTLPPGLSLNPTLHDTLRLIGHGGTVAVTWFILTIFLDEKRLGALWIASAVLISLSLTLSEALPWIVPVQRGYAALHFTGLLVLVIASGRGDLQNARRRLRPAVCGFILIYCIGQALTARPVLGPVSVEAALGQSVAYLILVGSFSLWAFKANLTTWPGTVEPPAPTHRPAAERSRDQQALIGRIEAAMTEGVWRIEGLTVADLAGRVDAPEHRVRRAINQVLGHRNFASFINRARVEAAMARLAREDAGETTILEVAYDVGFASLGPFNRAFREATGQSPTDYRKAQMGAAQDTRHDPWSC